MLTLTIGTSGQSSRSRRTASRWRADAGSTTRTFARVSFALAEPDAAQPAEGIGRLAAGGEPGRLLVNERVAWQRLGSNHLRGGSSDRGAGTGPSWRAACQGGAPPASRGRRNV